MRLINTCLKAMAVIVTAILIVFALGEKPVAYSNVLDQKSVPVTCQVQTIIGCSLEPVEIRFTVPFSSSCKLVSPPMNLHLTANNWPVTIRYALLSSSSAPGIHEPEIAFAVLEAGASLPSVKYSGWIEAESFNGYEMGLHTYGEYDYAIYVRITIKPGYPHLLYQETWQIAIQDAGMNSRSLEFEIIVEKEKGH